MLTTTKRFTSEYDILEGIKRGAYAVEEVRTPLKYLAYPTETYETFKTDVISMLTNEYFFNEKQSEVIFLRCWADCSIGGLQSVLDEAVDLASFSIELANTHN